MNKLWFLFLGVFGGMGEMGRGKEMVRSIREKLRGIERGSFNFKIF